MSTDTSNTPTGDVPPWLDMGLIRKALLRGGDIDENARLESLDISRATAPGDNYASIIYRAKVQHADGQERFLLVKTLPKGESLANAIIESGFFQIEVAMLAKNIPVMNERLDTLAPGRFPPFAARCPLHDSAPAPFLVLEDLKPKGFRLAERRRGLGLRHCLLALRTLARYHAASVALLAENPSAANGLPNFFRTSGQSWDKFVLSSLKLAVDACCKWPGYEEYVHVLERFKAKSMEIFTEINDPTPNGFNVIIHGDYWTNNMMFKYDENGQPIDFRMVDLQLSHVASPAIDLLYFLHTSLSDEVYENHERLLLREYHTALTETLDLFGLQGPSFKELMADIDIHSAYSLFGSLCVWPVVKAEEVPDINASLEGDSSSSNSMYESDRMKKWMQRILPEFKRRGWLNF